MSQPNCPVSVENMAGTSKDGTSIRSRRRAGARHWLKSPELARWWLRQTKTASA
jgi:hypothetical protein